MKQPKFKFGDKLVDKDGVLPSFIAGVIGCSKGEFYYYPESGDFEIIEYNLELFEEPKVKKLYAYRESVSPNNIVFNPINWFNRSDRAPEYDIEFPLKEQ